MAGWLRALSSAQWLRVTQHQRVQATRAEVVVGMPGPGLKRQRMVEHSRQADLGGVGSAGHADVKDAVRSSQWAGPEEWRPAQLVGVRRGGPFEPPTKLRRSADGEAAGAALGFESSSPDGIEKCPDGGAEADPVAKQTGLHMGVGASPTPSPSGRKRATPSNKRGGDRAFWAKR